MVASQNGHVEVVDKLLQHGATVDLLMEVGTCVVSGNSTSICWQAHIQVARQGDWVGCDFLF